MAVNINDLGLPPEEVGEIAWDAPESGSYPPQLYPGDYTFIFKLEEDPYARVEIECEDLIKRKFLQIMHIAKTEVQEPVPDKPGEFATHEVALRFQRVNFYKHSKMHNSSAGDLIRSLRIRFTGGLYPEPIDQELRAIEERRSYLAEVGWRAYCKSCEIEISTHPRKKRIKSGDQVAWPKNGDGRYVEQAACPKCNTKMYGNAEIMRYKLPEPHTTVPS